MNAVTPLGVTASRQGPADAAALVAAFDARHGDLAAATSRQSARTMLLAHGLPTRRSEAFRYTDLSGVARFTASGGTPPAAIERARLHVAAWLERHDLGDMPRLVMVDGSFAPELSVLPPDIDVVAHDHAPDGPVDALVGLNALFTRGGVTLSVAAGVSGGLVVLMHVGLGEQVAAHPRHALHLAAGASLDLIEISLGEGAYLHNAVCAITLDEAACLSHVRVQDDAAEALSFATVLPVVQAQASYDGFCLALGGAVARHEVRARLEGEGAVVHVNAAQLARRDGQVLDLTSEIRHLAPDTQSRQTVKTVLSGRARGVFSGRIHVDRIAQKTDGYQLNQALLLSDAAEMDARPELEIYADDVKCSHGVTIGALDEEQMFYMRSRGLPQAAAEAMLVRAFLADVVGLVQNDTQCRVLERVVSDWWDAA